jgi:serine/threonine protein kinase
VTLHDVGESDDLAYIAMEHLPGAGLTAHTRRDTLLPVPEVLHLAALAADALHYAHDQNVVHRDMKPADIMYDSVFGQLKLKGLGVARRIDVSRTRTGIVLRTPSFMSPEQLEGNIVNGHTDLFGLCVSLYQSLTGQLPFRGNSMTELMFVIAHEPHVALTRVRPELSPSLDRVMECALAKCPEQRYSTGAAMAAALRAAARQI